MRVLGFVALGMAFSCQAFALEASAGADTVNSSQIGIDTKLNATNAITTASINQILTCQKAGKLYDPTINTCIAVDEPLAKKIADCTTSKQFYNQTTDACQNGPPDLTAQTTTNASNIASILACNKSQTFYDAATNACESATGASAGTPTQFYKCPWWNGTGGGGDWASFGCVGQITNTPTCTNYWYNKKELSITQPCTPLMLRVN